MESLQRKKLHELLARADVLAGKTESDTRDGANSGDAKELLGIRDMRLIHTMLEIVVCWGIYPSFMKGVGIPLAQRSRSGFVQSDNFQMFSPNISTLRSNEQPDQQRLFVLAEKLTQIALCTPTKPLTYTTVSSILFAKHLTDLYAALLQLAYAPNLENDNENTRNEIRQHSKELFNEIFTRADMFRSLDSLITLLGSPPLHSAPKWLRTVCGKLLTSVLLRPDGVQAVVDFMVGGENEVSPTKMAKISQLILSVPSQASSVQEYFSTISPQLIKILQTNLPKNQSLLDPVLTSEQTISSLIMVLYRILVSSEPPTLETLKLFLGDIIAPIYYMYAFACTAKVWLKDSLRDVLLAYFRIVGDLNAIKEIVFRRGKEREAKDVGEVGEIYFARGESGGIEMRIRRSKGFLPPTVTYLDVDIFIDFLKTLANNELSGDIFMYLLNEYTAVKNDRVRITQTKRVLTLLHLILAMIDCLGSTIIQKPGQIISFVDNVLENYGQKGFSNSAQKNSHLTKQENHILDLLSDRLAKFSNHWSSDIRQMSRNLCIAISVRSLTSPVDDAEKKRQQSLKKYQEALEALRDTILPVRARGIVMLREMILARDPIMYEGDNLDHVLDIFIKMIEEEESFIYLNAVRGLSSLTDVHGEKIMKKLMSIYSNPKEAMDSRLHIGEAILQTIQRCGDALGKYILILLPPLLQILDKDTNTNLRMSALSIIGCACETSSTALTNWFQDLVDWILNILAIEKAPEIRRACVALLISLFRGLGSRTLYEIHGRLLKRAYTTLKYVEGVDKDDLTRYHARVALSDLDVIIKGELSKTPGHS
ncbi:659_t:CDS:10 [Paraglomus brasilianum]|uniref:659_t:CDS:1 n=1 Tax=Paraglomus brasilianum TaxID=144538 RepID=A0A9N9AGJ3_9GLOM|nr:659_t:CDS:10 [Paraglomus brasilianum]